MRKLFSLAILTITGLSLFAQMPGGAPSNRQGASSGHIYGKLIDESGKPVANASVIVMQEKFDSSTKKKKQLLFKSLITPLNGDFSFEDLPVSNTYIVKISSTGFKAFDLPVSFMSKEPGAGMPSLDKDLGNIKLQANVQELQGVTITATASSMRLSGDKKIFNVEKNIMSAGGTGVDVMRNVPSVNVDIDGNITMRNAAPQLLVDGRPTTLTLDQIPADAIESVEVISNPSAKYDASGGGAGILNIVLKKNKKTGYNGNVRAGVDKRGAMNGGLDFNVRQGKLNFNASVSGNQNKGRTSGTTDRTSKLETPQTVVTQNNYNKTKGGFAFGKVGLDYFATNRTTFSVSGIKVHGEFNPYETIDITNDSLFNGGKISELSRRLSTGKREFNGNGLVLGFKHLFPKAGEELTIDMNFFGGKQKNNSLYVTDYLNNAGAITNSEFQKALGNGNTKNFVVQSDYTLPLGKKTKLETGVRAAMRTNLNFNENYLFSDSLQDYAVVPSATSNYKYADNVYAAYGTVSSSIKDFTYKIGLRAESSSYTGSLTNTGEKFKNSFPVSLFPSIFLSQKLKSKQELQLSYSRRINRPNFFQLIPFTDYTDKLNISRGNANLVPEFTQSLELSYLKTFKKNNSLLASVYYKHSTDLITRYLSQETDIVTGDKILVNSYINANSSYSTGAEITSINYLTKWWDISTNLNLYNSKVNTKNISVNSQDAIWSMFAKFNSNFKLPSSFSIQLTTTYQSKTNLPISGGGGMGPWQQSQSASQGYIKPSWGMDLAVKKTFLKNNAAAISLSISDIFKTRINSQYSSSDYFVQNYDRLRDPQMVRLNLSYRFGKMDASLFKRKSRGADGNAAEGLQ